MRHAGQADWLYLSGHSGGVQRSASASRILANHGYSVQKVLGVAGPNVGQAYVDQRFPNAFRIFLNTDIGGDQDVVSKIGIVAGTYARGWMRSPSARRNISSAASPASLAITQRCGFTMYSIIWVPATPRSRKFAERSRHSIKHRSDGLSPNRSCSTHMCGASFPPPSARIWNGPAPRWNF